MFGEECKIGDLGLMRFKDEDDLAIDRNQRIGAFGWETPEAMNKFLTEAKGNPEFNFRVDGLEVEFMPQDITSGCSPSVL